MKDEKKSIIKEALTDYQEIMDAADANAKKKLAEEFPEKFNNLLKEEINKNKKSAKESYKKLDEDKESEKDSTELNKESVMKKEVKETKKVVKEEAGKGGDAFKEKPTMPDMVKEEREKDFMGDVEGQTPNQGKGTAEKGDAFLDKLKGPTSGTPMPNLKEEIDLTELDMNGVDTAIGGAGGEDEVLTMEQIEEEIAAMEGLNQELGAPTESPSGDNKGIAFKQLVGIKNQIDEMLKSMGQVEEQKNNGGQGANRVNDGGPTTAMIDEKQVDEMHQGKVVNDPSGPDVYNSKLIDEKDEISDADIEAVLGAKQQPQEQPVEEAMGIALSTSKQQAGDHLPGKEFALGRHKRSGSVNNPNTSESEKKLGSLINENKQLTKKLNEVKKYKDSVGTLLENYKTALEKYRNQLKEMAIFNTNLAHVNNLLVNESLALTQDDKIKIINEFKKVDSIAESQKKYKTFLTEMKEGKKTLTESVEAKVTTSVASSSKQKLDEVVEKTAYADDKHIQRMRKLIEYVEKRGKRIIE
jgi:hypothetical protein